MSAFSNVNFWLLFAALPVWVAGFALVGQPEMRSLSMLPLAWNGKRTVGFIVVMFGLDLCVKALNDETLFPFSTFFLVAFMINMGIMTVLGRPFLAQNLIPATPTKRIWLGLSIILAGVLGYLLLIFWIFPTLPFGLSSKDQVVIILAAIGLGIQFIRVVSQSSRLT